MNIPSRVNPFGYDNTTPPGYVRAEFLESTGSQYIYLDGELTNTVSCSFTVTPTKIYEKNYFCGRNANYYAYAIIENNKVVVGQIPYSNAVGFEASTQEIYNVEIDRQKKLFTVRCGEEEKKYNNAHVASTPKALIFWGGQGSVDNSPDKVSYRSHARMSDISVSHAGVPTHTFITALDPSGKPCMYDTITGQPFYNAATTGSDFIVGLTMKQAISLANLPDVTAETDETKKSLTVSLPLEATLVQYNQQVDAALTKAAEKGWSIAVQYRDEFEDSLIENKYAECKTVTDMYAVNPDFRNDLTEDGEWVYPLTQLLQLTSTNADVGGCIFYKATNLRIFKQTLPNLTSAYASNNYSQIGFPFARSSLEYAEVNIPVRNSRAIKGLFKTCPVTLKEAIVTAPYATDLSETFEAAYNSSPQLKKVTINSPNAHGCYDLFLNQKALEEVNIDFNDNVTEGHNMYRECRSLITFPTSYASLYKGDGMFYGCRITGQQAIEILNSLPAYENDPRPMTMGIHVDHRNDEEVLTAIANAEAKGWTLTVQWNGTPTAQTVSTFGLRKPPIYAKIDTMEHPDGTIENFLDWGHYVTNAEENGYQEFASKEEAYEHFNLEIPTEE